MNLSFLLFAESIQGRQFEHIFGQPLPNSYLVYAVRGFFENRSHLCYVVRLKDDTPEALLEGLAALELLNSIDLVCTPDIMRSPHPDGGH